MIVSLTTEVQLMAMHVTVFRNMQGKLEYTCNKANKIQYGIQYNSPSSLSQSCAERANDEETTHWRVGYDEDKLVTMK